jgi:NAD(P)-dependent dehydrogenase (short-subunit alcohol dehydrogenase family)
LNELFQLKGRSALVVGGGSGLGEAIAGGLAAAGARVAVADISVESAQRVAEKILQEGGEALSEKLDVTSRAEVEQVVARVVEAWGSVDILVNSAGTAIKGSALEYPEAAWDKIIATNLKGTFLTCQAAGRHMAARKHGKIINIASIGAMIAYPFSIAYLASKGGVAQLTKGFAVELAPFNVQVNAIAPSLFNTPLVQKVRSDSGSLSYFVDRTPAGRLGEPEEIVGSAVFLASDASSMVTGHILAVDGGFLSV